MSGATSPFIEGLVEEEIRRFVAEAIAQNTTLSTAECVAKIRAVYPTCGLSKRYLGDKVLIAAASTGVAVEIERVKKRPVGLGDDSNGVASISAQK